MVTIKREDEPAPRRRAQRGRPSRRNPPMPGIPKPFPCVFQGCLKSFGRRSDLQRHHNTHTGTRNHHCQYPGCGKSFIQTSALTVHKRTHTGEKPHACEICTKPFSDSSSLSRHRRTHKHGTNSIKCPVNRCPKVFNGQQPLKEHLQQDHSHPDPFRNSSDRIEGEGDVRNLPSKTADANHLQDRDHASYQPLVSPSGGAPSRQYPQSLDPGRQVQMDREAVAKSQPETPNDPYWQFDAALRFAPTQTLHRRPQPILRPSPMTTFEEYYDPGPLSAPICSNQHLQESLGFSYVQPTMSRDLTSGYHTSGASSPVGTLLDSSNGHIFFHPTTNDQDFYNQLTERSMVDVASPSESDCHLETRHDYISSKPVPEANNSANGAPQDDIMFEVVHAPYRSPQEAGIITHQQYQLPQITLGMMISDEEKLMSDIGEPLPSQVM